MSYSVLALETLAQQETASLNLGSNNATHLLRQLLIFTNGKTGRLEPGQYAWLSTTFCTNAQKLGWLEIVGGNIQITTLGNRVAIDALQILNIE